ncbi:hypothetical protein INR49_016222 [Caranx melampygus]|nr:hypothetical protein INR49_016222 [Caranx melampygus]
MARTRLLLREHSRDKAAGRRCQLLGPDHGLRADLDLDLDLDLLPSPQNNAASGPAEFPFKVSSTPECSSSWTQEDETLNKTQTQRRSKCLHQDSGVTQRPKVGD